MGEHVPEGVSPLPWRAVNMQKHLGPENADTCAEWVILDDNSTHVMSGRGPLVRRIVHAANAYPRLVAALELACSVIEDLSEQQAMPDDFYEAPLAEARALLRELEESR